MGAALEEGALLTGDALPFYRELARYVFFTTTGEQLDETQLDEEHFYLGESRQYEVYMIYQPSVAFLKSHPLMLDWAEGSPRRSGKPRLVVASYKLLDSDVLRTFDIEYYQFPFGIYRFRM